MNSFVSSYIIEQCKRRMEPFPCEGFIYGQGPKHPAIMFVGEAPGETEIYNGIPFSGRAGQQFNYFLKYLHLTREDVFITSAVRSRPYKWGTPRGKKPRKYNRTPNQKEIAAHAPILDEEINQTQPSIIVPMGRIAYWRLLGTSPRMNEITGYFQRSPVRHVANWKKNTYTFSDHTYTLFPIYHPAAILYKRSLESTMYHHLDRLKEGLP